MQGAWFATALGGALVVMSAVLGQADVRATAALDPAIKAAAELPRLHSLLVSHRGVIILERYFNGRRETTPANVKSVSKSVIAALVGIASDRKLLSLDDPIGKYFPDLTEAGKRAITVEDLLTMRSGLESTSSRNYGAWVQSSNWIRHALAKPLLAAPGTQMIYSTGNSHLLSAILAKAAGKSTLAFAQEALAKPLGFSLSPWMRDPQGNYFGGNEMVMTPRQMLAFGEMYRNGGQSERPADPVEGIHRRHLRAARAVADQRPRVRLRLVDARYGWAEGVLRMGLRRSVHRARAEPRPDCRVDVRRERQRRSTRPSAHRRRNHRAAHRRRARVAGAGLKSRWNSAELRYPWIPRYNLRQFDAAPFCHKMRGPMRNILTASLLLLLGAVLAAQVTDKDLLNPDPNDYLLYSGTYDSQRHSLLKQINTSNVGKLQAKWIFHLTGAKDLEAPPIVHKGVMYIGQYNRVHALDAATGRLIWEYMRQPRERGLAARHRHLRRHGLHGRAGFCARRARPTHRQSAVGSAPVAAGQAVPGADAIRRQRA